MHPLHALHGLVLGAPHGDGAVVGGFDVDVDGHKRGWAVVLRPVELHATADPGTGEADEGGLDDLLAVEKVIAVGLVLCIVYTKEATACERHLANVDAPADFRKDHDAHEFILEPDGVPLAVLWDLLDAVGEREGVDAARAALVDALFDKHGVDVGRAGWVGGQGHWLAAHDHGCVACAGR